MGPFDDRVDAGRQLARRLEYLRDQDIVVLGLPRGGVPVAFEVAEALRAPLDVLLVRKLGVPFHSELAFGAIGDGGVRVINDDVVCAARLGEQEMAAVEKMQTSELARRSQRFRGDRVPISLQGRTAVIVDDGVATGATAQAACQVARTQGASKVILAVPVGATDTAQRFAGYTDELVCLQTPDPYFAVGQGYRNFAQTSDDEVVALLERARVSVPETVGSRFANDPGTRDEQIRIATGYVSLAGRLTVPEHPAGIVVFAHGSGSSSHSPRNRYVANVLNAAGLATLLCDLLTPDEERSRATVFDIGLLTHRLVDVTGWLAAQPEVGSLPVGYFGASTGAGAALAAAAHPGLKVSAVVSRGGRPDLASEWLPDVPAPTLLIVGGRDQRVLELNRRAREAIPGTCELAVIPGATHLFEEPGTLEQVATLARDWFIEHLSPDGVGGVSGTTAHRGPPR